jgi:LuxR family transcriptional regulator, quorum-sensing system regulator SolR
MNTSTILLSHFEQITTQVKALAFDACEFGFRRLTSFGEPKTLLCSSFSGQLQMIENAKRFNAHLHHAVNSPQPVVWNRQMFSGFHDDWHRLEAMGLTQGCTIPSAHDTECVGVLSVARHSNIVTQAELNEKVHELQRVSNAMYQCMSSELQPFRSMAANNVTARELETMRWIADGKTSIETSKILGITERTVNFHVNNVIGRLGVQNKTAAAVQLAMRGLLF